MIGQARCFKSLHAGATGSSCLIRPVRAELARKHTHVVTVNIQRGGDLCNTNTKHGLRRGQARNAGEEPGGVQVFCSQWQGQVRRSTTNALARRKIIEMGKTRVQMTRWLSSHRGASTKSKLTSPQTIMLPTRPPANGGEVGQAELIQVWRFRPQFFFFRV